VSERGNNDVGIIALSGHVRMGEQVEKMRNDIDANFSSGQTRMVVSMEGVRSLDSSALGVLVRSLTMAKQRGGTIKLAHVPPSVAQTLQITGIWRLFEVFDNDQKAVDSFSGSTP
jgi:anti-anti-sigma factor